MNPRFDPSRAIVYDLARGQLSDDEGSSRLNLPVSLVTRLCSHAGAEAAHEFGRALGEDLGRRISHRLGEGGATASIETWTEHLGGQLALVGLGDLAVESWGKALVLRVLGAPEGCNELLGAVLTGALQRSLGRQMEIVSFVHGTRSEFLVLSQQGAARARELISDGAGLGNVVEELHRGAA
jgi:hypothetical protein